MEAAGHGGASGGVRGEIRGGGDGEGGRGGCGEAAREDRAVAGGTGFFGQSVRAMSIERRRQMVEPEDPRLSILRQCELVSVSRLGFYHRPAGRRR
jgi:hypothetical protein